MFSCIRVYKMLSGGVFLMPLESLFQFFFCHLRYFTFVSHLQVKPCTNVENFNLEESLTLTKECYLLYQLHHIIFWFTYCFSLLQNLERTLCNLWQVRMNRSFINICCSSSPSSNGLQGERSKDRREKGKLFNTYICWKQGDSLMSEWNAPW